MREPSEGPVAGDRPNVEQVTRELAEPFDAAEVKFKPAVVSGNRALALAYVDARVIQDRLDEVLGVDGWQDDYEHLPDGNILCRLRCRIGDQWVLKTDVGGPSEQPDGGDRTKAAVSDALKRAAVKFGVGRYLYRLPQQWADFDPRTKRIVQPPTLPAWALPAPAPREFAVRETSTPLRETSTQPAAKKQTVKDPSTVVVPDGAAKEAPRKPTPVKDTTAQADVGKDAVPREAAEQGATAPASQPTTKPAPANPLPANGTELLRRLQDFEARLVKSGVCGKGDLLGHIKQSGVQAGHPEDLTTWSPSAIALAAEEARRFETQARKQRSARQVA